MIQDPFSLREQEIFNTLKALKGKQFVVIGGYAVNAYALPRFSVDCDIVIKDGPECVEIETILVDRGYVKETTEADAQYRGSFVRYEKKLENNFVVSIDILIDTVSDRLTEATFSADWINEHSRKTLLRGKTITEELEVRIITRDALIVMKMIACRATDIRDVFMMIPEAKNKEWIKTEINLRYNLQNRVNTIIEKVTSKQFKDGIAGVYGNIDAKLFKKHTDAILSFEQTAIK